MSQSNPSTRQVIPILRKEKRTIQVSDTSDSDTSSVRMSKRQLKTQKKTSQSQSIVQKIQNTEGYSTELPNSVATFIGLASTRNPNKRWTVDPNPNFSKFASRDDCIRGRTTH